MSCSIPVIDITCPVLSLSAHLNVLLHEYMHESAAFAEAEAPVGSYDDNFLTGGLQFDGATGDQQPLHSATERRYVSTVPFTAAIAAAVLLT